MPTLDRRCQRYRRRQHGNPGPAQPGCMGSDASGKPAALRHGWRVSAGGADQQAALSPAEQGSAIGRSSCTCRISTAMAASSAVYHQHGVPNAQLAVREGWAVAYRRYSRDLHSAIETKPIRTAANIWSRTLDMRGTRRRAQVADDDVRKAVGSRSCLPPQPQYVHQIVAIVNIFVCIAWVKIRKGPCHAPSSSKPVSRRALLACSVDGPTFRRTPAPKPIRIDSPSCLVVPVDGRPRPMRPRTGRVHPAHNSMAGGAAAADLALPNGCVLRWACQVAPHGPDLRCPIWWFRNPTKLFSPALRSGRHSRRDAWA